MLWNYEKIENKEEIPNDLRENFKNWTYPEVPINNFSKYGWRVFGYDKTNPSKLKIGYGSDISAYTVIFAHCGVIIEPFVQIGPHCSIISKSTIDNKSGEVHLGKNCRIGAYSTIMPGINVGKNSIVGAYTFVNKDIPPNSLAMGIPCIIERKKI